MPPRYEHASEDELEAYALGSLSEGGLETFEEHLLICDHCRKRLTQTENFIRVFRVAAGRLQESSKATFVSWPERTVFAGSGLPWLWGVLALVLAVGVWFGWQMRRQDNVASSLPFTITLQALRGGNSAPGSHAPAGRPLLLEAETGGLVAEKIVRLELVDGSGTPVGEIPVQSEGTKVRAYLPRGLSAGRYWVRLEGGPDGNSLLREYSLEVD